jgi:RNA polymerase sigma-70 factor (ECF subfamily)
LGKITRNLSINRFKWLTAQKRGRGQMELVLKELENCIPTQGDMEQLENEIVLSVSVKFDHDLGVASTAS